MDTSFQSQFPDALKDQFGSPFNQPTCLQHVQTPTHISSLATPVSISMESVPESHNNDEGGAFNASPLAPRNLFNCAATPDFGNNYETPQIQRMMHSECRFSTPLTPTKLHKKENDF